MEVRCCQGLSQEPDAEIIEQAHGVFSARTRVPLLRQLLGNRVDVRTQRTRQ